LANRGAGVSTFGGMRRFRVCRSWQMWQVQMYQAMLAFRLGHQNRSATWDFMAKTILCPISS
jgi:NAD-dependent SIR2 family protein deacetylase